MRQKTISWVIVIFFSSLLAFSAIAYEPTLEEIFIKKRKLADFCDKADNKTRFDICEKFGKVQRKISSTPTLGEAIRQTYDNELD